MVTVQKWTVTKQKSIVTVQKWIVTRLPPVSAPFTIGFGKALARFGTVRKRLDTAPKRFAEGIIRFYTQIIR